MRARVLAALIGVLVARGAGAEVAIGVVAGPIFSDNIALAPEGLEETEQIMSLAPSLRFTTTEESANNIDLTYQAQAFRFAGNPERDSVYHTLNSLAELELVADRLFLDIIGVYDETTVEPDQTFEFSNINLLGNRTEIALFELSPYTEFDVGERAEGGAGYSYQSVRYPDDEFVDSTMNSVYFAMGKTEDDTGGTWSGRLALQRISFDTGASFDFSLLNFQMGIWAGPTVRLFTTQGVENDFRTGDSGSMDQHYWDAGMEWRPSDRANLLLTVGQRYFSDGNTYMLNYSRTLNGGNLYVRYDEQPSTGGQRFFDNVRALGQLITVDGGLNRADDASAFIQKRFETGIMFESERGSVEITLIDEQQVDRVGEAGVAQEDTSLEALEARWRRLLRPNTEFLASLEAGRREIGVDGAGDRVGRVSIGVTRQVGRRSQISLFLVREKSDPLGGGNATAYETNVALLRLSSVFGRGEPPELSQEWL